MDARVGILMGIPSTAGEFETRRQMPKWDYGDQMGVTPQNWRQVFHAHGTATATVATHLCRFAETAGHAVYRCATLDDVRRACTQHELVILVAHWKGSGVGEGDLRGGWETALEGIMAGDDALASALRARAGSLRDANQLAAILNDIIRTGALRAALGQGPGGGVASGQLLIETLHRELIDVAFGAAIERGNCLELYDGMHAAAEVAHAVGPAFSGVLDLSCCTSSILATFLRMQCGGNACYLAGDAYLIPAPQMRLVLHVLTAIGDDIGAYRQVKQATGSALHDYAKSTAYSPCQAGAIHRQ